MIFEITEILKDLITVATKNKVNFVYALSPGIDIMYSSPKEIKKIKEKLEQVREAGCNAFALLFDDIETSMQNLDKQHFASFATAQVSVTNEIYKGFKPVQFFFCPTEYCESRAVPQLNESEYLHTIGEKLHPDIQIMWTGPRVVSRILTVEHLERVSKVIRRNPLVWDNLHANDYDPKRVYLGPFYGRPVAIRKVTSGLLLNPNCKYETNFVPIQTLGDWNSSEIDGFTPQTSQSFSLSNPEPIENAVKLSNRYDPLQSLSAAAKLWHEEFGQTSGPSIPPIPRLDTAIDADDFALDRQRSASNDLDADCNGDTEIQLEEIIQAVVVPEMTEMNEAVNSLTADYAEPMEINSKEDVVSEPVIEDIESEQVIPVDYAPLCTLIDMFYLPFEHGERALQFYEEFTWLYENCAVMAGIHVGDGDLEKAQVEWLRHFDEFENIVRNVFLMFKRISNAPNKALVSEVIPYVWEAHGICATVFAIAKWLKNGGLKDSPDEQSHVWSSDFDDEPWSLQGGFVGDSIRMLCQGNQVNAFLNNKLLLPLTVTPYELRPFCRDDIKFLGELSRSSEVSNTELQSLRQSLIEDRYMHLYIELQFEHTFLAEEGFTPEEKKAICFAAGKQSGQKFFDFVEEYVTNLKQKYAGMGLQEEDVRNHLSFLTRSVLQKFYSNKIEISTELVNFQIKTIQDEINNWYPRVSDSILINYPSYVDLRFSMDAYDSMPMKRILHCISVTLTMTGKQYFISLLSFGNCF
ncbi:hypothetical protein WR25_26403 isoform B [Diploscapter pachys]|uniref:GH84 domain-containing protein n=1 Tax=Diploscapter pachys TaxID=2018661 RepID=A0A2A2M182_9BILA|nr:hypothetical protein WR25_26403 isoform B [Diploscapter pachys]